MPKLLTVVQDALARHHARHAPSGFRFALADSIDFLDGDAWDALTARSSVFLSRRYLRALESASPENLQGRYAVVYSGRTPAAAIAAQSVLVDGRRVGLAGKAPAVVADALKARLLVAGNLLSWGQHAVAFAHQADPRRLWPGVAEALYRLRRADKLEGRTDFTMLKDFGDDESDVSSLRTFSYRPLATDPNMVLAIAPRWRSFDDYLADLHSKYRKNAVKVRRDLEAAEVRLEPLSPSEVVQHADRLHALYLEVNSAAAVRPVTISPSYLPALTRAFGPDLKFTVARRGSEILGFVTTLKDGDVAVGYYIGFDRGRRDELPLYFALLQQVVADAIAFGCKTLSLGRTALEPKAKLGCKPVPTSVWVRHTQPALNVLARRLLSAVPHDEAPDRSPFKDQQPVS